jgi:hypothetical protein
MIEVMSLMAFARWFFACSLKFRREAVWIHRSDIVKHRRSGTVDDESDTDIDQKSKVKSD